MNNLCWCGHTKDKHQIVAIDCTPECTDCPESTRGSLVAWHEFELPNNVLYNNIIKLWNKINFQKW